MKPTLLVGLRQTLRYVVPASATVPELLGGNDLFRAMPAVLATPNMVALMEWAATELLDAHAEPGEGSLGAHVDVAHLGATLPGQTVTVTAEVTRVDGRKVTFAVEAHDGIDRIGAGTHVRMIVRWDRFAERLREKAARIGGAGRG
jgi:fluoroacetyl-CoA thioesterase